MRARDSSIVQDERPKTAGKREADAE
jgi:hypothetical protein